MTGKRPGPGWHIVEFLRRFVESVRHVRTGGQSTRARAARRASRPPRQCPECHQPIPHSPDWRDHIHREA